MSSSAAYSSVREVDTFLGVLTVAFPTMEAMQKAANDIRTASEVEINTSSLCIQGYHSKRKKLYTMRIIAIVNGRDTADLDTSDYVFDNVQHRHWGPVDPQSGTNDVLSIHDYIHTDVWHDHFKFFYDLRYIRKWPRKEYMTKDDDESTSSTIKSSGAAAHPPVVPAQVIMAETEDLDTAIKRRKRASDRLKKITPKSETDKCKECGKATRTIGAAANGTPVKWCDECGGD